MNKIEIGKIVSTHGIKGEMKIRSSFPYKEKAFLVGSKIQIEEKDYEIKSYRTHKNYDMITLTGYQDINDVLPLMKKEVYKKREDLHLLEEEVLDSDLLAYSVRTEEEKGGEVIEIFDASSTNKILRASVAGKEILLPFSSPYVKVDPKKKEIVITLIEGM